jgi:hypothetical protein
MMPVGELITSAISNKGNPTGFGQDNTFRVQNAQEVRIVDNKGNVLFSGIGPDAARQAVALGQSISDEKGNKAGWTIQTGERTINTDGSVGPMRYYDVANEKVNKSVLGKIADVALPVVGGILAGPLGAAAGSAASSVAQGRGIEDVLLRAAIAGGTSALIPGGPSPADTVAQTAGQTAGQAATQAVSQAATQAATQAAGDIVVNAIVPSLLSQAASGAVGGLASSVIPSVSGGANASNTTTQTQPSSVEATTPAFPDEILVTAQNQPFLLDSVAPALTSAIASTAIPELTQPASTTAEQDKKGIFQKPVKDWGVGDWLDAAGIAGIAAKGVGSLLGGGGDGSTAMPYASPFGAGTGLGLGTGRDMRVNPNITDYERYGFGPEATFFAPGYSQLVSGAAGSLSAPTTTGPASAMINPQYVPLI